MTLLGPPLSQVTTEVSGKGLAVCAIRPLHEMPQHHVLLFTPITLRACL